MKMKRKWIVAGMSLALLAFSAPALAGGPRHYGRGGRAQDFRMGARLHVGVFTPDGESEFFDDNALVFTGSADGFEDTSLAADLEWALGPTSTVVFSVGTFEGSQSQAYLDYVDEFGGDIRHRSNLRISPMTVGLHYYLGGRDRALRPYLGAGAGLYFWRYREVGDFIVFGPTPADDELVFDAFESDGTTVGYYLAAGVDFRISEMTSLFVESRWHDASDELADDFDGLGTLDLSGRDLSFGLAWRF
ncbi:MAG: outer membrane beta-barrel protein [Acidobacteriota bacterium]|nr:outer membrane beta-barrel protein [Acidobacteriota bacterium]